VQGSSMQTAAPPAAGLRARSHGAGHADLRASEPVSRYFAQAYERLKVMARRHTRGAAQPGNLCTTEIVHELYLRMNGEQALHFGHELEFFAYAARALRHVLIDMARQRQRIRHGGDLQRLDLDDDAVGALICEPAQALELDAALRALSEDAPRAAQVVELHCFAGLSLARVAQLTASGLRTVERDWQYARSFLALQMGQDLARA
jgi:RNA polymerase sigma factor (TIGR02999 family)